MLLIFYLCIIVLSIAFCIVAFLLIAAGDLHEFIRIYGYKPRTSILPVISKFGDVIATPQDVDAQLAELKLNLKRKYAELEALKTQVETHMEQSEHSEQAFSVEVEASLVRAQHECGALQDKIEYFRRMQVLILEDVTPGKGYKGDADWLARSRTIL